MLKRLLLIIEVTSLVSPVSGPTPPYKVSVLPELGPYGGTGRTPHKALHLVRTISEVHVLFFGLPFILLQSLVPEPPGPYRL